MNYYYVHSILLFVQVIKVEKLWASSKESEQQKKHFSNRNNKVCGANRIQIKRQTHSRSFCNASPTETVKPQTNEIRGDRENWERRRETHICVHGYSFLWEIMVHDSSNNCYTATSAVAAEAAAAYSRASQNIVNKVNTVNANHNPIINLI